MTTYLTNRDGGKTNEEGHIRFQTKVWSGAVANGLQAVQRSPLAMGVNISVGDAKVDYSTYSYTVWTDAVDPVAITTADPSNPRIDRIVGYVDRSETPSSASENNPGLLKFMAIAGTPAASPSRPSNGTVQTAVGASNPYFDIADVLVGTGVTTISNANITDTRVMVTVGANTVNEDAYQDGSITTDKLNDAAVTSDKIADANVTPEKLNLGSCFYNDRLTGDQTTTSSSFVDVTDASSSITTNGGALILSLSLPMYVNARSCNGGLNINGVDYTLNYTNSNSFCGQITGFYIIPAGTVPAGTYTVNARVKSVTAGDTTTIKAYNTISFSALEF